MKKILIVSFGFCLAFLMPRVANAGVQVGFSFGPSCYPQWGGCDPYPWNGCGYRWGGCGPYYYSSCNSYYYSPRVVYVEPAPIVYARETQPVYVRETEPVVTGSISRAKVEATFYRLGHNWAQDLRDDVVTRDQFIKYLKSDVFRAPTQDFNDFRNGFITSYGVNGEAAFDKALQQARAG